MTFRVPWNSNGSHISASVWRVLFWSSQLSSTWANHKIPEKHNFERYACHRVRSRFMTLHARSLMIQKRKKSKQIIYETTLIDMTSRKINKFCCRLKFLSLCEKKVLLLSLAEFYFSFHLGKEKSREKFSLQPSR